MKLIKLPHCPIDCSCFVFVFAKKKKILPGMYWMLHVNTDLQDLNVTDMIKFDVNKLSQHTHF